MAGRSDGFREELRLLRADFIAELPERVRQVRAAWERARATGDAESIAALHRLTHNLAGSGATFSVGPLSETAHDVGNVLAEILVPGKPPTMEQQARVDGLLVLLSEALILAQEGSRSRGRRTKPTPAAPEASAAELPARPTDHPPQTPAGKPSRRGSRVILLVDDDPLVTTDLATQMRQFGYVVQTHSQLAGLDEAVEAATPGAMVMDIIFPEGPLAGARAVERIQEGRAQPLPVVFISARTDIGARLAAVRAGGLAYFPKPVDVVALVDKLDALITDRASEPYRVLIIEDEGFIAAFYALALRQAGMLVEVVTDPLQVMQPLVEFRPDLVLMDVYMPGCTGMELAAAIRQQDAYVTVPILFLSVEDDPAKQFEAISLGGDDFLTKPIRPEHLVLAVTSRARRSRLLRSLMARDSLTGLLNHTNVKEQLSIEVLRARRKGNNLAFAMIDLDRFKRVNDTYGHPVGDRVLKSLSRLLEQRLRRTDIIGRYGGEEFAAILLDTDGPTAVRVMDEIRNGFQRVRHQADGSEFSVTLSCGIATFPEYGDATSLNEAADRALYEAKRLGRNRTVIDGGTGSTQ